MNARPHPWASHAPRTTRDRVSSTRQSFTTNRRCCCTQLALAALSSEGAKALPYCNIGRRRRRRRRRRHRGEIALLVTSRRDIRFGAPQILPTLLTTLFTTQTLAYKRPERGDRTQHERGWAEEGSAPGVQGGYHTNIFRCCCSHLGRPSASPPPSRHRRRAAAAAAPPLHRRAASARVVM